MIRAVIIEDEINNSELLNQLATQYLVGVEIVAIAENVEDGILCIQTHNPDLVFLDIEMPGGTGFDVLTKFTNPTFKVIFTTGYEHYAIKAIKHSAIDYLLKPINLDELRAAISKVREMKITHAANIEFIKSHISNGPDDPTHLLISSYNTSDTVIIKDILYLETQERYTIFHLTENRKRISALTLNFFETLLNPGLFFRIHRSIVVNCEHVRSVGKGRAPEVTMSNNKVLQVAYRRKTDFLTRLRSDQK